MNGPPGEAPPIPIEMLAHNTHYTHNTHNAYNSNPFVNRRKRETERNDSPLDLKETIDVNTVSKEELRNKLMTVYTSIYAIRKEIDLIVSPEGSKQFPARNCRDLYSSHPTLLDGWYWIDPNLGVNSDAIHVFCNMTAGGHTCVAADKLTSNKELMSYKKERNERWFSSLKNGYKITYEEMGSVQLTFLRLLSKRAYQTFTYQCINSVAWYSQQSKSYDYSIKFLGQNNQEFGFRSVIKPEILDDGCKLSNESSTQFMIQTTKPMHLPIVDFWPSDYGLSTQQFGYNVGPICFH
ncbi:unnamed protein product [Medioppia subpectinata]|uniref:Fibrillar collagen NC1 domain-containing protein n=1 Tax=Medioppia subpectinata TaxID=1979941 RepID=A0A7R9KE74_9ACAR|nr:unnamed protein product [Medioppia subpectinata]CAG2101914.1 unnamed protein product [Medioppia subpectinata]